MHKQKFPGFGNPDSLTLGDIIFTPWIKYFSEIPGYSFFTKEICRRAQFESNNTSTCNVGDLVNGLVVTPAPMMPDEGETSTSGDSSSTSCVGDVLHESDMLEAIAGPATHFVASSIATSCVRSTQKRSSYGQRKEKRSEKVLETNKKYLRQLAIRLRIHV